MARKIFVNLPVNDLAQSRDFFEKLGFHFDNKFCDDTAACLILSEHIFVMLLTHPKFEGFSPNPVCDTREATEALLAVSCQSRKEVDSLVETAVEARGRTYSEPQDHGFMYGHGFQDLDGHVWELMWTKALSINPHCR